ncbi:MAG: hypothetical protein H8D23_17655 [Candidatus Brocadiales bacterium]|nr:hypothetical protein [Candidatus Brocadiales bacterium]
MKTKLCTGECGLEKPLTEEHFAYKNKEKGKWHAKCKECTRAYNRKRYAEDPELRARTRANSKIQNRKTRVITQAYVEKYKTEHPCEDCDENDPVVLDFHHTGELPKKMAISRLVKDFYSLKMVKEEIKKCVVVCANCHRRRHAEMR